MPSVSQQFTCPSGTIYQSTETSAVGGNCLAPNSTSVATSLTTDATTSITTALNNPWVLGIGALFLYFMFRGNDGR
jgi:hypothetical protein